MFGGGPIQDCAEARQPGDLCGGEMVLRTMINHCFVVYLIDSGFASEAVNVSVLNVGHIVHDLLSTLPPNFKEIYRELSDILQPEIEI